MEQWYLYKKKADFTKIGEKFQIDPVIARLIRNRDVIGDEEIHKYLYGNLSDISDPFLMKGVREGVDIIREKIRDRKTIRIISDYDVDGVVSNYILWKAIYDLGGMIDFQIPDRMKDGYGINENIIEKAVEDQVDTILTCDNGIAAADAVAYGKEHGLTMIITDHHDVPFDTDEAGMRKEVLPPADVVINPKQEACNYPYPLLCGAGVAFQFMRAFYQAMEEDESQLEELMKTHQTLEHITKLNKSLLLLSKIENGQFTDTVQVEVNKLLRQYLEDYKEVYQYREIITSIEEEGVFYLTINETLAVVLLTNLLKNAFVHNIDGGHIRIVITPHSVMFCNTGAAQPLDARRIFERFYQGKKKEGSTGLGLAIADTICKMQALRLCYEYKSGEHCFILYTSTHNQ